MLPQPRDGFAAFGDALCHSRRRTGIFGSDRSSVDHEDCIILCRCRSSPDIYCAFGDFLCDRLQLPCPGFHGGTKLPAARRHSAVATRRPHPIVAASLRRGASTLHRCPTPVSLVIKDFQKNSWLALRTHERSYNFTRSRPKGAKNRRTKQC